MNLYRNDPYKTSLNKGAVGYEHTLLQCEQYIRAVAEMNK